MNERIIGPTSEPELLTLLDQVKRQTTLAINCVQIGTIESYAALTNTAKVKINFQLKMGNGEIIEYPLLDDCPVFTLSGGNSFVSCPIANGDNCIVLFNDRNIDNWYLTGETTTPADTRAHSIADGIVLVGINPINDPKQTPLNSLCVNGGSKKVSILNDDQDLKTLLTSLNTTIKSTIDTIKDMNTEINAMIDAIGLITVTCAAPGSPSGPIINAASFTAIKPVFDGYKTTLDSRKSDLTTLSSDIAELLDEGAI